jgi:hypothetical protein
MVPSAKEIVDRYGYEAGYNPTYVNAVMLRLEKILSDPMEHEGYRRPTHHLSFQFNSANFAGVGDHGDWLEIQQRLRARGWRTELVWAYQWQITLIAFQQSMLGSALTVQEQRRLDKLSQAAIEALRASNRKMGALLSWFSKP